jgi:DNA-binding IclR family transcriptional regulator
MLIHLAKGVLSQVDLTAVANPYLSDLSRQLGETVKLSVVKGNLVEVVACVESSSKFRIAVTVGEDFPIHAGAASKALLAFLPEAYREAVIGSNLQRFTPNTITDPAKLRSTLSEVRESGIAYDEEEFVEGIRAVASPVFNFLGEPVAAVSVAFLAAGDHEETVRAGREAAVREVARAISLRLGGVPVHWTVERERCTSITHQSV